MLAEQDIYCNGYKRREGGEEQGFCNVRQIHQNGGAYHYAEDSVRGNIEDFTSLRTDIGTTYRDYAMKLIDIYGDSIKMVSPDLFDFDRIEWLDVDDMLKYVELEYKKLSDKCAALMGEISDSFRASLQSSLKSYKSLANGNTSLGLAMAGLTMLDHYMAAGERTNRLKEDLSVFQTSVKRPSTEHRHIHFAYQRHHLHIGIQASKLYGCQV